MLVRFLCMYMNHVCKSSRAHHLRKQSPSLFGRKLVLRRPGQPLHVQQLQPVRALVVYF